MKELNLKEMEQVGGGFSFKKLWKKMSPVQKGIVVAAGAGLLP